MSDLDLEPPSPLHEAVRAGLPVRAVERRLRAVADVDARWHGRTALWDAVMHRRHDAARLLAEAGADPWLPLIGGWSPGRLALAGPEPALFGAPPPEVCLTPAELSAVARAQYLIETVGGPADPGVSAACLGRVDSAEATGRLRAVPIDVPDFAEYAVDPRSQGLTEHEVAYTVGVSDVAGGCVVTHWGGTTACSPGVLAVLTRGTTGCGCSDDGGRGAAFRDGRSSPDDSRPGLGHTRPGTGPAEVLRAYLYYRNPLAHCCDATGVTPDDRRAFTGPPDHFLRLPPIDLWPAAPL